MKIVSHRLGDVDVDESRILTLPEGIIGFASLQRYVELDFLDGSPIKLLQAVDSPKIAFFITDPTIFLSEYNISLSRGDLAIIGASNRDDVVFRAIVTIPDDPYEMTANLQGPLILNLSTMRALQVVNNDGSFSTKHKVLQNPATAVSIK